MFRALLRQLRSLLGLFLPFLAKKRQVSVAIGDPVQRIAAHIQMLSTLDSNFLKLIPELQSVREEARDIFMFLASAHMAVFGDEYGIPVDYVLNVTAMSGRDARRVRRTGEINRVPRYLILYSIFSPVSEVRLCGLIQDVDVAALMKIAYASQYFTLPLVFVMDVRMAYPTPVQVDPAVWPRRTLIPRFPGPRLYYNIERSLRCEETEDKLECVAYVEDGAPMDTIDPNSSPSTEIIYVKKIVRYIGGERGRELDRRIVVAYVYNLLNLLADEDIFRAYGILG